MAPRVDEPNVFHYTKDQHAHSILNTARIKFTDLSSPGNDIHELRGIVQEYQVVKDLVDRFVQYLGTKDRFLCGCASADVHSAWVTYANGYRGVCLGFAVKPEYRFPVSYTAIPHDVDSLTREAMARSRQLSVLRELVRQIKFGAIDYDEAVERIVRYAVDWTNIQVLLRQVLSTKSTEWVHEKEIRIGLAVQSLGSDSSAKVVGEGFSSPRWKSPRSRVVAEAVMAR